MTHHTLVLAALAGLAILPGCETMSTQQRTLIGLTAGSVAGLITADLLDADSDWRLIAALGGAAAGALVAQNTTTGECAYARGDGTYTVAPCP
jgi:osmotically inducible lipoprotein OsmB